MERFETATSSESTTLPATQLAARDLNCPIRTDEVLFVVKRSKFLRDQISLSLDPESLMRRYEAMGESGDRVLQSHLRQEAAQELCRTIVPRTQVTRIEELDNHLKGGAFKVVVAVGGDDFFKLVSHHIGDSELLLGINSDPGASKGFLLAQEIGQLPAVISQLNAGAYQVKEWTRLRLKVDGIDRGAAINDVVMGKRDFLLMSKHELEYRGKKVVQASSGLLVSTGVGSTGWFTSGGLYLGTHDRSFPPTSRMAAFELLSPAVRFEHKDGARVLRLPECVEGKIEEGETLKVTSLNDDEAVVARDSLDRHPFPRGTVVEVSIDPEPLKVISVNPENVTQH